MEKDRAFSSVVKNRGFLNLWANQLLVQLSYNLLNFTLIIWVFYLTSSNTAVSTLLLAVYLPAAIFGLFAGVLVDVTDRRRIIMAINILLMLSFLSLIFFKNSFPAILAIAFFNNTLAQFYVPAEFSAIPIIVKKAQLLTANSIFSTTLYVSFLVGFGLAGPTINYLGIDAVFKLGAILLSLAFFLSLLFPPIVGKYDQEGKKLIRALTKKDFHVFNQIALSEIKQTIIDVRGKLPVLSSILILAGVQMMVGVMAVLTPPFLERAVRISATDASSVLVLPLGLGMVVGGLLIGRIGHLLPRRRVVGVAITVAGILLLLVGLSPLFAKLPLSNILVAGSFLLGIAAVSIVVPSQTVLQENTPEADRGKVFAVLGVMMALVSVGPVLLAGILADLFGPLSIFIGAGLFVVWFGLFILKPSLFFAEHHLAYNIRQFLGLGHWQK